MNRRVVAGAAAALLVLVAALAVPPDVAFARLAWLAADPVRLVAALLVLAAVRPFLAWPTTLLAVLAGYGFGLAGAPLALALITLTSVPTYLLARRGRTDLSAAATSSRLAAGAVRAVDAGERAVAVAGDTRAVAASRLVPAPSDVVSVGAGLAGVPLWPFLVGTAVGEVPWAVAGTVAGASAGRLAAGGVAAVFDPRLILAAAVAAVLLVAGPAYRHYASRDVDADGEAAVDTDTDLRYDGRDDEAASESESEPESESESEAEAEAESETESESEP